jgi:tetrahydromethanopterin S-methyltransferase subunit H
MFSFTKEQKVLDLGSIHFGGQPGLHPTVLFGGLFFKGELDFKIAGTETQNMLDISKKVAVPGIPDVFIKKEKDIDSILSFLDKTLPNNYPFSVDITDPEVKVKVLKKLEENGFLKRVIYNSIHVGITEEEQKALSSYTPAMAIIVAFNPKDKSPDGKIEVLENGAHLIDQGLLDVAKNCGINNILIDTAALAPGDISGAAIAALPVVKEEFGLPSGCAIHNVVEKSSWLTDFKDAKPIVDQASNINIPVFGGDFLLYGPIEHSSTVFPIIAWQDILVSEYSEGYFGVSPSSFHPRRRFFDETG